MEGEQGRKELPERLWREVTNHTREGLLIADSQGTIIFHNKAWLLLTGKQPNESMIGENISAFRENTGLQDTAAGQVLQYKKESTNILRLSEGRVIYSAGRPLFDEDGDLEFIIVNVQDLSEVFQLREKLKNYKEIKNLYMDYLKRQQDLQHTPVVASGKMSEIYKKAVTVSAVDVTVLILGESGVGKEVLANFIHQNSMRKGKPFLTINCGAIPESLLESELFGYMPGAFTGASKNGKPGIFEAANKGTLLLDEIGEISNEMQVKLLRVLETKQVTRIGATSPIDIDVRILVATNRNLIERMKEGQFRSDLYYRINIISLTIPPLRERPEDVRALSIHFLNLFNLQYHRKKVLNDEVLGILGEYPWYGNVRELRNIIEQLVILSESDEIELQLVGTILGGAAMPPAGYHTVTVSGIGKMEDIIEEAEKQLLERAMERHHSTRAIAKVLGVSQTTISRKLRKYHLQENTASDEKET